LVGDNTAENITLAPAQLASFSAGLWMLDGNDTVRANASQLYVNRIWYIGE
jgi:hypothetical protein